MPSSDGRVIVSREGDGSGISEGAVGAVDTATHKVLWSKPGTAYAVTPDTVILTAETTKTNDANYPQLTGLDPATGKITKRFPRVVLNDPARDGDAVYDVSTDGLRALDPITFKSIWELPEGNRMAPEHPAFFGGLVYGQVNNGMSVILDGTTGEDITADIPGTFVHVNEHGALMRVNKEVVFVPATG